MWVYRCDCLEEYEKYLPNYTGFLAVYGTILLLMWLSALCGLCRKQRCNLELGIAGFPNTTPGHLARLQVPLDAHDM